METLATLSQTPYVNLGTYHKDETLVDKPVWSAAHDNTLYIISAGFTGLDYE